MHSEKNITQVKRYFTQNIASFFFLTFFTTAFLLGCKKEISPTDDTANDQSASLQNRGGHLRQLDLKLIADSLTAPLGVVYAGGEDDKRLFIIDQIGKIWILDKHGNKLTTPFLDISSKLIGLNPNSDERGMLGVAFHPNYKLNGKFYVYYSSPARPGGPTATTLWNNFTRVSEFKVSATNPNLADINSERLVLGLDDPQGNHNAGTIQFGPTDGYLYIAIGDGGGANDVNVGHVPDWYLPNAGGNGQDIEANLFGNILRIDIDHGSSYAIPADNPFVGKTGLDEIYAYGLRNPYRFSFDMEGSHALIAGDVGQRLYEEIDVIKKGRNYGWNVREGFTCFNAAASLLPFATCPDVDNFGTSLTDPVISINNTSNPAGGKALAVVGGNVYRGNKIHGLEGKYIFGTYAQSGAVPRGELFMASMSVSGPWQFQEIALKSYPGDAGSLIKGFGQDKRGEIYLTTSTRFGPSGNAGKVYKLIEVGDDNDDDDDD